MNHLSEQELFEYIDDRSGAAAGAASRHIAECEQCRTRIALHLELRKHASHVDAGMLSKNFTKRIMRDITVPQAAPRFSWLIENSANIFALVVVAGIVGFIIAAASQSSPDAGDSAYTRQLTLWHDAYTSVMNALAARNRETVIPAVSESTGIFGSVFWTGVAALVALGSLDKLRAFTRTLHSR